MEIKQNTLYLTTQNSYVSRDHLTLRIEVERELKLAVPIHHLESICVFGQSLVSPAALELCWKHGVPVNYFSETGYFLGRWEGVANTSVMLRRAQYRAADNPLMASAIARQCVAGKLQNSRQSLLRSARETESTDEEKLLRTAAAEVHRILQRLREFQPVVDESDGPVDDQVKKLAFLDCIRGFEGQGANIYFRVFSLHLKQQRADFLFKQRTRRPPRDPTNCLLSFLYALVRHDCIAALTTTGLDPYVGYLHADRPNRPGLALDLMEEFRPLLADRLAVTLINRRQVELKDFVLREAGACELKKDFRKALIAAYQTRKQDVIMHPILNQEVRIGHLMLVQARILARHLRGDIAEYLPCVLR